ncbi:MAG: hypothetical protein WB624_15245, partial [Xanthobacteraceae bacterium]
APERGACLHNHRRFRACRANCIASLLNLVRTVGIGEERAWPDNILDSAAPEIGFVDCDEYADAPYPFGGGRLVHFGVLPEDLTLSLAL